MANSMIEKTIDNLFYLHNYHRLNSEYFQYSSHNIIVDDENICNFKFSK